VIRISISLLAVVTIFAGGGIEIVGAATPLPAWYGQANTTREGYEFTNASLTPAATLLENANGTPAAVVSLGSFADGWQDPANPVQLSGVAQNGAWDLGTAGAITVQCAVAANPPVAGTFYRIDFEVYVVAYKGITALPSLNTLGLAANDLTLTQTTVAVDPVFPGATWEGLKWTGYFDNVSTNTVSFAAQSPTNNTSIVDTYEVFTRATLVPEPSTILLFILPAAAWLLQRRRS